jgi:hypothetical protein
MRDDGSQPWKSRQRFKRRKPEAAHKEYTNRKQDIYMFFLQRQELMVLRTCGFKLCSPETKRLLIKLGAAKSSAETSLWHPYTEFTDCKFRWILLPLD